MRRLLIALATLFISSPVYAEEFPWRWAEIQIRIAGELPVIQDALSLNAHAVYFSVPGNDVHLYFMYVGVKWMVTDWFWVKPMLGYVGNWSGGDSFDISFWTGSSLFGGNITFGSESDILINGECEVNYYAYYTGDLHLFRVLNIGLQMEQVNMGFMFGPHIGVTKPIANGEIVLAGEIQYYLGFQDVNRGHTIRTAIGLEF